MKVLHIVPTYMPAYRYGGPIVSVHEMNKELVKNGVEVTVYTTNVNGRDVLDVPLGVPVDRDGVTVYYFPCSRLPLLWGWYYSPLLRNKLRNKLRNFDLVHITSVFLSASTWGARYAKQAGKPYIISPRGSLIPELIARKSSLLKKLYLKLIEKKNLSGAAAIHFTTELEREEYLKLSLSLRKAVIIPNGVEIQSQISNLKSQNFRKRFHISEDAKIVLSLGRLNWKKGFDTLIPAFAEVVEHENKKTREQKNNVILLIAGGDDGYKHEIEKLITNNYKLLTNAIIFTGDLRGEEKSAAYACADVFVMPSYSENFGITAVEAMAAGVPVVASDAVGIAPEIKNAHAGVVIKKDASQLTKAILGLLNDKELAGTLGANGRKLAEKFSWPEIGRRWVGEYQNLIK